MYVKPVLYYWGQVFLWVNCALFSEIARFGGGIAHFFSEIARFRAQIAHFFTELRVSGATKLRAQNRHCARSTNVQTKSHASGGIHFACSPAHFTLQPSGLVSGTDTSSPRTSSESTRSKSFTVTLLASFG